MTINDVLEEIEQLSTAEKWQIVRQLLRSLEQEQTVANRPADWQQFLSETYGSLRDTPSSDGNNVNKPPANRRSDKKNGRE